MDIAQLAYKVDSSQLERTEKRLDRLPAATKRVEDSSKRMATTTTNAGRRMIAANDNAARSVFNMSNAWKRAKLQIVAAITAITAALVLAVRSIFTFHDALTEVSTLVDTSVVSMDKIKQGALGLSAAYGTTPSEQVKAYYQAISAGASNAKEATDILTVANKLAVGGVTDIKTAVDGLTNVLNAYGMGVEQATGVSDTLFIAMRSGKTTIGELSTSLGKVAPLAASAGVSFDELAASIAALTKGGISTTESVTGVRAILAAIAKPTSQAAEEAKRLGLQFNVAAVKAKGFQDFLADVIKKTGGNTDSLSLLFGGVEALVPALALAGTAGKDFNDILEQMKNKSGATQEALDKMANSPVFQGRRIGAALSAEILKIVDPIARALVPAMKLLADNMENIFKTLKVLTVALAFAFGPQILAGVGALASMIGVGLVNSVRALWTVITAHPIGFLITALATVVTAAFQFRDQIKEIFGVDLVGSVKEFGNFMIGSLVGSYRLVTETWKNFPKVIGDAVISAVNRVIDGINALRSKLSSFTDETLGTVSPKVNPISHISNPYAGAVEGQKSAADQIFKEARSVDYIGSFFGSDNSTSTIAAKDTGSLKNLNNQVKALAQGVGDYSDKVTEAKERTDSFGRTLLSGFISDFSYELRNGASGWKAFGRAALNALDSIIDRLAKMASDSLFNNSSGGFLGNMFGFLGGGDFSMGVPDMYVSGGYTGNGPVTSAAGIVHGQEYVVNAAATRQHRPLLEAINSGSHFSLPARGNAPVVNNTINIDARGAVEGTDERIKKAWGEMAPGLIEASVAAVGQKQVDNGGNYV